MKLKSIFITLIHLDNREPFVILSAGTSDGADEYQQQLIINKLTII